MRSQDRERRFTKLRACGCVACGFMPRVPAPIEIHHLNLGGKAGQERRGDEYTIPLCTWHHRGDPPQGFTARQAAITFGPSLARQSRAFRATYGHDDELLVRVNEVIDEPMPAELAA